MNKNIFLLIFLIIVTFSCKENETLSSFAENNQKIEDSNENLNIKNESFLEAINIQAEKDDDLIPRKEMAKRVHAIGVDFYKYIDDLKNSIKDKNSMSFVNELFFNNGEVTTEGQEFLMYIKNYRESMNTTIEGTNPRIVGMVNNNFDTSVIEDRRGQETNWLTLNFKDLAPIISIAKLSTMQADIRRIETQYLAELLGVKLQDNAKKVIDQIKKDTSKQISENVRTTEPDSTEIDKPIVKEEEKPKEVVKETPVTKEVVKETPKVKEVVKVVKTPKVKEPKKITPKKVKTSSKKYHTVKKGENMYRIALKYKTSIAKIQRLNGMKNNSLRLGQKLRVK